MKLILSVLFLLIISSAQALNQHDGFVESRNDRKHELSHTIRKGGGGFGRGGFGGSGRGGGGFGGSGRGGGGFGGAGKGGGGGGFGGGVAGGIIGGYIGGSIANGGHNGGYHGTQNSATTISAWPHFCVSTLILCMSFWL